MGGGLVFLDLSDRIPEYYICILALNMANNKNGNAGPIKARQYATASANEGLVVYQNRVPDLFFLVLQRGFPPGVLAGLGRGGRRCEIGFVETYTTEYSVLCAGLITFFMILSRDPPRSPPTSGSLLVGSSIHSLSLSLSPSATCSQHTQNCHFSSHNQHLVSSFSPTTTRTLSSIIIIMSTKAFVQKPAPAFTATTVFEHGEFKEVNLSDYKGQW